MARPAHPGPAAGFPDAFVARMLDDAPAGRGLFGLSGLQGSGKSTLAAQLVAAAARRGRRAVAISIDDFYLDRPQRARLAREVHPLLATRGPPGTHDLALAAATFDALAAGRPVRLPRFDKLTDRRLPESQWPACRDVALVVFEGWCLGTPPEREDALAEPVNALERDEDADGAWRGWCNAALARDYPPLWARIDRLLFLQPPGFDIVRDWRWQQERALQAGDRARPGMSREQVDRFVQHFERVGRQALRTLPGIADAVVRLDARRRPLASGGAAPATR